MMLVMVAYTFTGLYLLFGARFTRMSDHPPAGADLPRGVALLVAGAFFMEILDATIITPGHPEHRGIPSGWPRWTSTSRSRPI